MDEFRKLVAYHNFCKEFHVTISLGIDEYNKKDNLEEFIDKADKKLYKAKESGRNRVVCDIL